MTTSDIDQALRVLNIEPLYGHAPHNPPIFRRAPAFSNMPNSGPVYFVEDEEIDFDRVLREEKIALPKGVNWTAHWLAVEGVQPLVPENPPAIPRDVVPEAKASPQINGAASLLTTAANAAKKTTQQQTQQQLVKQVLSKELQLYYGRLTSSLLPPSSDFAKRTAALASLRSDAGLQALLPYLIRWVGEGVVGSLKDGVQEEEHGKVLEVLLEVISAILGNKTLFVEPYVSPLTLVLSLTRRPHVARASCTKFFLPSFPRCFTLHYRHRTRRYFARQRPRHSLDFLLSTQQPIPRCPRVS